LWKVEKEGEGEFLARKMRNVREEEEEGLLLAQTIRKLEEEEREFLAQKLQKL
jgi:hypothetical protein